MADYRQIHTKIWKDGWFIDLEPEEKLLFLYLFTNSCINYTSRYEIPLKVICFYTDINIVEVMDILSSFEDDGVLRYSDGHIELLRHIPFFSHSIGDNSNWNAIRWEVLKRDKFVCQYCRAEATEADHVIPRIQGGLDDLDNLVAACKSCNVKKSGRTPEEAEMDYDIPTMV